MEPTTCEKSFRLFSCPVITDSQREQIPTVKGNNTNKIFVGWLIFWHRPHVAQVGPTLSYVTYDDLGLLVHLASAGFRCVLLEPAWKETTHQRTFSTQLSSPANISRQLRTFNGRSLVLSPCFTLNYVQRQIQPHQDYMW